MISLWETKTLSFLPIRRALYLWTSSCRGEGFGRRPYAAAASCDFWCRRLSPSSAAVR